MRKVAGSIPDKVIGFMFRDSTKGVGVYDDSVYVDPSLLAKVDHNPKFFLWNFETFNYINIYPSNHQGGGNRYLIYVSNISYVRMYAPRNWSNKQQLNTAET
jgi:hypothetical protein